MSQDKYTDQLLRMGAVPGQSQWLRRPRAKGHFLRTTLLVGHPHGVAALNSQLLRRPRHDFRVIGCCLPTPGRVGETFEGLPVLGGPGDVVDVVRRYDVDMVAVLSSSGLDGAALRRLESDLKPTRADLLLAPAVTGAAGSHARKPPVPRSPSQRERPGLYGANGLVKASFDRVVAAVVLVLLAPVLIGVAMCVKATSRGPVFVRQERVGRDGRLFHLLKFRSTAIDAGRGVDHPAPERDGNGGSEIRRGPGETRLGSILRRSSIDELPQFINVLKGDMSLVGPRPGLPAEMAPSGTDVRRRSPVKPGLTGLAQISSGPGRSLDDGARSDVDYVENWSLFLDLIILGRTFAAVLRGGGST